MTKFIELEDMSRTEKEELDGSPVQKHEAEEKIKMLPESVGDKRQEIQPSKTEGLTLNLVLAICACAGSSFQVGYNTGCINAPGEVIQDWIREVWRQRHGYNHTTSPGFLSFNVSGGNLTTTLPTTTTTLAPGDISSGSLDLLWSIIVSVFALGGMAGGLSTAYFTDKYGRKGALLMNNGLAIIGGLLEFMSKMAGLYELIIIGRLIIGLNCGLNSGAVVMYLTEIAPRHLRGALGSVHQLVLTISILVSQILGLPYILGNPNGWPFLLGLTILPAVFQLATLPFCPESPKHLLKENQDIAAKKALHWLRKSKKIDQETEFCKIDHEMDELRTENERDSSEEKVTVAHIFTRIDFRMAAIITIVMNLSQQLSGINAVIYYSTRVFEQGAGMSTQNAVYATIGVGAVNVIMTVISTVVVDHWGRKTLHLVGLAGMCLVSILLTVSLVLISKDVSWAVYVCIIGVFLFVVFFATGPGTVPWFIVTELFTTGARGAATSVGTLANWLANFLVGLLFPTLQNLIDQYVFLIFAVLLFLFCAFTWVYLPETKGRKIDEITDELSKKRLC